jgi:hypothetical protein
MTPVEQVREAIITYGRPNWVGAVSKSVRDQVPTDELIMMLRTARKSDSVVGRADGYGIIDNWCKSNVGQEANAYMLGEICGFSAITVRKYMDDRPDLFNKIRRGVWNVRDPQTERARDKTV